MDLGNGSERPYQGADARMTADAFAELLKARRTGRRRWQGKCPAHDDRTPSLAIHEGQHGRVLIKCWGGCSLGSVLTALSLTTRDLFAGPPPSARIRAKMANVRDLEGQQDEAKREVERRAADRFRRFERIVALLGSRLAKTADDAADGVALTEFFHQASSRLSSVEEQLRQIDKARANGLQRKKIID
jgi:hypothetical protein